MKMNLKRLALLVLLIGIAAPIQSQSLADSKTIRETEKITINGKNLRDVIRDTKNVDDVRDVREDKGNHDGAYWFNRGFSMHQSNHYIQAIEAFSHSIGLGHRQATCMYNVACGYSMLNDKESALFWLERSISSGFDRADLLKQDSDLDPLRSDPRFKEILQKATLAKNETNSAKDKGDKGDKKRDRLDEAIINFEQLNRTSSKDGDQWYKVGSRS